MMPLSGFPYLSEPNPGKCHDSLNPALSLPLPVSDPFLTQFNPHVSNSTSSHLNAFAISGLLTMNLGHGCYG